MGETQVAAATVGCHRHQSGFLEHLEHLGSRDSVVRVRPERRTQRQELERPSPLLTGAGHPRADQFVQPRGARQRPGQPPYSPFVDEGARLLRAENELAEEKHLAAARRPQHVPGRAVDGSSERVMQEGLDTVSRQVVEVDTVAPVITPKRGRRRRGTKVAGHRRDEEDDSCHEQLSQERRRRDVEQGEVVDHDHETGTSPTLLERTRRPGEHLHCVKGFTGADLGRADISRQQMRHGPQWDCARLGTGSCPPDSAVRMLGHLEALLGQTRFPYTGRTMDDERVTRGIVENA